MGRNNHIRVRLAKLRAYAEEERLQLMKITNRADAVFQRGTGSVSEAKVTQPAARMTNNTNT
jgi:hypothetical protein